MPENCCFDHVRQAAVNFERPPGKRTPKKWLNLSRLDNSTPRDDRRFYEMAV
jgi:hypothetical protein